MCGLYCSETQTEGQVRKLMACCRQIKKTLEVEFSIMHFLSIFWKSLKWIWSCLFFVAKLCFCGLFCSVNMELNLFAPLLNSDLLLHCTCCWLAYFLLSEIFCCNTEHHSNKTSPHFHCSTAHISLRPLTVKHRAIELIQKADIEDEPLQWICACEKNILGFENSREVFESSDSVA